MSRKLRHYSQGILLDILTTVAVLGLTGIMMNLVPLYRAKKRVFAMWKDPVSGAWTGELRYSYPHIPLIISSGIVLILVTAVPILIVLLFQLRVRSLRDTCAAVAGMSMALVLTYVLLIQPRPNQMTVLKAR